MRILSRSSGYAGALLLAGTAALAAPAALASAAVQPPPNVPCSSMALAAAIQHANSVGSATLLLAGNCNYVLTTAAAPADGLPPITGNLVITGAQGTTISRSSSAPAFRILHVAAGGSLTLTGVTVANGFTPSDQEGGGIKDEGTLALRNVQLTGNRALNGGGLFVGPRAHAAVSFTQFSGNAVGSLGGAVINEGALVMDHSRLTGNTAPQEGGGVNTQPSGTSQISSSAVFRNRAGTKGGGLSNRGTTVLFGDRVLFNTAGSAGGGIASITGTVSLRFTLVVANSPDNCSPRGAVRGCPH
jgi:hypothetical protein